jgi:hypothetical protein
MSGIQKIINSINNLITKARIPIVPIPAILLLSSVFTRPGASAMVAASNVIRRQSEFGAPTGKLPSGDSNKMNQFIYINMEETMKELRENAVIEAVVPPNSIVITAYGGNAGGPITVTGSNILPVKVTGILR